jgi:hypothetical protein
VSGARIDTFAWAGSDGQTETDERVLITESVEEAVMFTEEAAPEDSEDEPGEVTEAAGDTPAVSKRTSGLSGTGRVWADPGYQKDKKQRYDLSTKDKAKAAWSYINQAGNAAKYTATQLKRVKSRIKAALGKFGVTVAAEGWTVEPAAEVTEAVAEWYGSPETAGSYSITATNGPTNVSVSGYGLDPAELSVILAAACKGASAALATLDPDMGGDIDVPGAPNADTDHDTAGKGETAPEEDDPPVTESEPAPAGDQGPAPAGTTESEGSAMPETATTTEAGGTAPAGLTPDMLKVISEATAASVTAAFEARDAAKAKAKADREAAEARESAEKAAQREALVGLLESVGIKVPADGTPPAAEGTTETADGGKALTEADVEKRVDIAVSEALVEFKQALMTSGAILPARAGLVVREHAIPDADNAPDTEALQKMSDDDLMSYMGGAMAQQADLIRPVGAQA